MKIIDHSEIFDSPRSRTSHRTAPPAYRVPRKEPQIFTNENLTDSDYEDEVAMKNDDELLDLGFIGTDDFGFYIAKTMMTAKKGASYHVWSDNTAKKEEIENLGGTFTLQPRNVFDNADVIFYFVSTDKEAENILFKTDALRSFKKGKSLVIMSTLSVRMAKAIQASVTDRAGRYLELLPCRSISKKEGPFKYTCCGDETLGKMIEPILQSIAEVILRLGEQAGTAMIQQSALDVLHTRELMIGAEIFAASEKLNLDMNLVKQMFEDDGSTTISEAAACILNEPDCPEVPVQAKMNELTMSMDILPQSLNKYTAPLLQYVGQATNERRYMNSLPNAIFRIFRRA